MAVAHIANAVTSQATSEFPVSAVVTAVPVATVEKMLAHTMRDFRRDQRLYDHLCSPARRDTPPSSHRARSMSFSGAAMPPNYRHTPLSVRDALLARLVRTHAREPGSFLGMNSGPFGVVAFVLLAGLGAVSLFFLIMQARDLRDRRVDRGLEVPTPSPEPGAGEAPSSSPPAPAPAAAAPTREPPPVPARPSEPRGATPQAPAQTTPSEAPPAHAVRSSAGAASPERPAKPAKDESSERRRLQKLLDRGFELEQNAPSLGAIGHPFLTPATRVEDVDAWEAEVEAALWDRPRDLALFRYERPRSPLEAFATISAFDNPLKRRLRARLHQLEIIVKRTP
jgi:hypothetical protein